MRFASFAASITSSSLTDPPGCITALAKASIAASKPSLKGKKASLAHAPPAALPAAFSVAILAASLLLGWPTPIPTACLFFDRTIPFDETLATIFHANSRSIH